MELRQNGKQPYDSKPETPGRYHWDSHALCLLPTILMALGFLFFLNGDSGAADFFKGIRPAYPGLTMAVQFFTDYANSAFYALYIGFILIGLYQGKKDLVSFSLACLAVNLLIVVIMNPLIKSAIGRPRPFEDLILERFTFNDSLASFPSGHTTAMAGLALPLAQRYKSSPLWMIVSAAMIFLMGFSRIYLNRHYPTDILGGLIMGSVISYMVWRLNQST